MKVNQFFNNKRMIVLLISVIIFISTIAFSITRSREETSSSQLFVNDMTSFATVILAKPAKTVNSFVDSVDNLIHTYEENQHLKNKIDDLENMQANIYSLTEENQAMKEELDLQNNLTEYTRVSATVIARNPDTWLDQIIVDKGSQDGLEVDMSVMSGQGLIGRVSEVSATTSKILLLSTKNATANRISAEIQMEGNTVHGIVDNFEEKNHLLIMSEIDPKAKIEVGKQVVTSGLGGVSPKGLAIGTVKEIRMDEFGLFQEITIEPTGNISDSSFVTVIVRGSEVAE